MSSAFALDGGFSPGLDSSVLAPFSFVDLVDQEPGSGPYRALVELFGVTDGVVISAINGELSNDGGATWEASVAFVTGLTFLRSDPVTASAAYLTAVDALLTTVSGVSDTFTVTTRAETQPVFSGPISDQAWQVGVAVLLNIGTEFSPPPTNYTLSTGALPSGLSIVGGIIQGTPTTAGSGVLQYQVNGGAVTNLFAFEVIAATSTSGYVRSGRHMVDTGT